jgi:mannose/fructose-specific phosphotransferase system component IIA
MRHPYVRSPSDLNYSTQSEAAIVDLAWKSSAAVYELNTSLEDPNFIFEELLSLSPSLGGTVKATTITIVSQNPSSKVAKNSQLPMLVIAVKGTKSKVDMMVNANNEGKSALGLFVPTTHLLITWYGFLTGIK